MNPIWKVYKSKVLKTLNPDLEEYTEEEVENKKLIFHLQISPADVLLSLIRVCVPQIQVCVCQVWALMSDQVKRKQAGESADLGSIPHRH